MVLTDQEIFRYDRQITLKTVDFDGQEKLKTSRVLIVGLGGLGCAVSQYLAGGGIGFFTLVDFDRISLSNLPRQILYRDEDIGQWKVECARKQLLALNPYSEIQTITDKLKLEQWKAMIAKHDIVVDCTDNVEVREMLNQGCFNAKRPLISGSAIRFEGQITVFDYQPNSPCYHCLSQFFGDTTLSCVEAGVISPIVGVVGNFQALETIKILLNIGTSLSGRMLLIDGLHASIRQLTLQKQQNCAVCSKDR